MGQNTQDNRIALQLELSASPTRVFQALLAPDDLCHWFCAKIRTSPHRGGGYHFWGESAIATLYEEGDGGGPIYGLQPAASLWYCWPIAQEITDVVYYLSPQPQGTTLQLIHQGLNKQMMLMDFWHLRLYALKAYVEGTAGPGHYDYSPRAINDIHHELLINAAPAQVFNTLVDSEQVSAWMNAAAHIDPRLDGLYDLGWRDAQGYMAGPQEILAFEPGKALSYRWQYGEEVGIGHEVHITLVEEAEGTLVSFEHVGFDPLRDNRDYDQGWLQLLWSLKALCETGGMPIEVLEGGWEF